MPLLTRLKELLVRKRPVTAEYRASTIAAAAMRADELPNFTLRTADLMRFDSQVRIGIGARNGLAASAQVDVTCDDAEIAQFVSSQWNRIWSVAAHQLLKSKLYGFVPLEVMYREVRGGAWDGAIVVDHLKDRHPRDTRLLTQDGETVGFELATAAQQPLRLLAPKALVCTFDAEFGNPHGCSLLARAYPAWYEKWMAGGAKKTLRLRMIKDAYIGDIFWYPVDTTVQLPGGQTLSWRDIAREMLESRTSGGAMTLPLLLDREGRKLMDYTPPHDVAGGTHIFEWKRDVDLEIWKSLEIPPEIIEASTSGSGYSGRAIPLMVALSSVQLELSELIRCVDRDVLRPLTQLNFGRVPPYDLRLRPLAETFLGGGKEA